jgi:hypothetical protein
MQLILEIDESQKDVLLNIIQNLRNGIVKNYTLSASSGGLAKKVIEHVSLEEEEEIKEILNAMTVEDKEVAHSTKYSIDL